MLYGVRDYQVEAVEATWKAIEAGSKGVLLAMATGVGKTHVAGMIASRMDSMLFIVDREELAFQSKQKLEAITGRQVALECGPEYKAHRTNPTAKFVVAMSQSLIRRLGAYRPDRFDYMIEDECHHSPAAQRTAIRNHFSGSRAVIGLSATPKRADGRAAGEVYDTVAYKMDIITATDLGWLTPFRSRVLSCNEMDLRGMVLNRGEFNAAALRVQLEKDAVVQRIAEQTIAIADGRQTVIFARTVEQSQMIDRYLRSKGERSTHVDGKVPTYARRDRLGKFASGYHQFICNCNLIEEGVDVPGIEVVAMAAPCRSTSRFIQRCGRGLRPVIEMSGGTPEERRIQIAESRKPWCTIIDFIGQMDQHCSSMCFVGDLLGGEFDDEERKVAIRLASGNENPNITAIMAEAKEIVARRRVKLSPQAQKEEARRRYAKAGRVQEQTWCVTTVFCPYAVLRIDKKIADMEVSKDDTYGKSFRASEDYLKACKLTPPEIRKLSSKEIVYLARVLMKRSNTHAGYLISRHIHARGYDASNLTKLEAHKLMERITGANYVRPDEDGPNELYESTLSVAQTQGKKNQNYTFI